MNAARFSLWVRSNSRAMRVLVETTLFKPLDVFAIDIGILIAAAGKVDDEHLTLPARRLFDRFSNRVCRFERRDDAFGAREPLRRYERRLIARGCVFRSAAIVEPRVLGTDRGIIKPGTHRVRERDLTVFVLQ